MEIGLVIHQPSKKNLYNIERVMKIDLTIIVLLLPPSAFLNSLVSIESLYGTVINIQGTLTIDNY